jgi:hypothetical protein
MDASGIPTISAGSLGAVLAIHRVELTLTLAVCFATLSLILWRLKGRCRAYHVSQFFGLAFVIVSVAFVFEKISAVRLEHHMRAEYGFGDSWIQPAPETKLNR